MHRAQKKLPSNQTLRDKHHIFLAYIRNINHGFQQIKPWKKSSKMTNKISVTSARSAVLLIRYANSLVNKFRNASCHSLIRMFILLFAEIHPWLLVN